MKTLPRRPTILILTFFTATLVQVQTTLQAQEKSVRPGVNREYEKNPNATKYAESFETEGREAFKMRKEIVAACHLKPGMSVADVGAGSGLFTRLFAAEITPGGIVYATDIAENFLKHIEETCKDDGIKNVKTVLAKTDTSGLAADSVDLVFLCDVYHHFEFPQKTLASLHAALKSGGRLIVVDYRREKGKTPDWLMKHVRAGQDVVTREIEAAAFKQKREETFLKDNYMLEFERVDQISDRKMTGQKNKNS
jgi:predicted methyltransferase